MAHSKPDALQDLIAGQLAGACDWPDEQRDALLAAIHERHGQGICAILIYGSYLRGKRDTLLDFYVLLDNYSEMPSAWQAGLAWTLSPNVYQVCTGAHLDQARAKYALMTLGRFEHAMARDFHSYFWARFAQPSGLLYCRDEKTRNRVVGAIRQAACTFSSRVAPGLPDVFVARDLVSMGLSRTYQCELRSEPAGHAATLYEHNSQYYQTMVKAISDQTAAGFHAGLVQDQFVNLSSPWQRRLAGLTWGARRAWGKLLSVLRLLKAVLTFDRGFDYLLWKIGRHSNIHLQPSELQSRYPLIFGWPLLWKLYRRGGFR